MRYTIDEIIDDLYAAMEGWIYAHSWEWHKRFQVDSIVESYYTEWSWEHDEEPPELTDEQLEQLLRDSYEDFCTTFGVTDAMEAMEEAKADFEDSKFDAYETLAVFVRAIHLEHCHGGISDHCIKLTADMVDSISQNGLEQTFGEEEVERFVREW